MGRGEKALRKLEDEHKESQLVNKYLLGTCYMPDTFVDISAANECGAYILLGRVRHNKLVEK